MTLVEFLILLIIAGVCGAAGQAVTGYSRGGCFGAIAVGFVGSLIGTWLARSAGLPPIFEIQVGGTAFPIVWSILGGALFVALLSLVAGRGRRY